MSLLLLGAGKAGPASAAAPVGIGTPVYVGEGLLASGTSFSLIGGLTAAIPAGATIIVRHCSGNFGALTGVNIGGTDLTSSCTFLSTAVTNNRLSAAVLYTASGFASGTAVTLTTDNASSNFDISYVTGIATSSPVDVTGTLVTATSTTITHGVTPTYGGDVLICSLVKSVTGQADTFTFDAQVSPNNDVNGISGSNVGKLATGFDLSTGTTPVSYTHTNSVSRTMLGLAFVLKAA